MRGKFDKHQLQTLLDVVAVERLQPLPAHPTTHNFKSLHKKLKAHYSIPKTPTFTSNWFKNKNRRL